MSTSAREALGGEQDLVLIGIVAGSVMRPGERHGGTEDLPRDKNRLSVYNLRQVSTTAARVFAHAIDPDAVRPRRAKCI